jgi:predicted DNA-binding transcriptional regulator AlpA
MSLSRSPALASATDLHTALTGHRNSAASKAAVQRQEPLLLSATEAATLLGMSERQFHKLRPRLPAPIVLGPRQVRWRRADLSAWVLALAAAEAPRPEPSQLRAGKARKASGCGGHLADSEGQDQNTKERRGIRQRVCQSNSQNDADAALLAGDAKADQ